MIKQKINSLFENAQTVRSFHPVIARREAPWQSRGYRTVRDKHIRLALDGAVVTPQDRYAPTGQAGLLRPPPLARSGVLAMTGGLCYEVKG